MNTQKMIWGVCIGLYMPPKCDPDPLGAHSENSTALLTGLPHAPSWHSWAAVWSNFPVYKNSKSLCELTRSIATNDVTIIISPTGSGKTQLTPLLAVKHCVDVFGNDAPWRVAVTMPKIDAATGAAVQGAIAMDTTVGDTVGLMYRNAPRGSLDLAKARLVYATDGALLSQARKDPLLSAFNVVIIDEAHERPMPTDMLILALRKAMAQRKGNLRIVIMSATIDPALFISYFDNHGFSTNVVTVPGSTMFPIQQTFVAGASAKSYMDDGLKVVASILSSKHDDDNARAMTSSGGDILFFIPTSKDAIKGCKVFKSHPVCGHNACDAILCSGLYRKLSDGARQIALDRVQHPLTRKLLFATNIAESSLNVLGLRYVIDSGLELSSTWMAGAHGTRISKGYTTQAQIKQRIGRVGRVAPGVAFHLYSKKHLESLRMYPDPAILTNDMTDSLMAFMCAPGASLRSSLDDFSAMLTPPSTEQLVSAVSLLHFYRLIDVTQSDNDKKKNKPILRFIDVPYTSLLSADGAVMDGFDASITDHGQLVQFVAQKMKYSVWNALLVVAGIMHKCLDFALALASILEITGGELDQLWWFKTAPSSIKCVQKSDHKTLVRIYQTNVEPVFRTSRGLDWKDVTERFSKMELSPGKWRDIDKKVMTDRHMLRRWSQDPGNQSLMSRVSTSVPWYSVSLDAPKLSPEDRTILSARGYHVCAKRAGVWHTVVPPISTIANLAHVFHSNVTQSWAVYESLVVSDRGTDLAMATCFPPSGATKLSLASVFLQPHV